VALKFAIVRPRERRVDVVDVPTADDAKIVAGLTLLATDEGTLYPGLGYICHEHAMFDHPQFYFSIGRTLIAGNVVLYAFDATGRTVNYNLPPHRWGGRFLGDEIDTELAVRAGKVERPRMRLPGEPPFWEWPAPKPDLAAWSEKLNAVLRREGAVQIDDITLMALPDKKA
jgi:hypothetical protein